MLEDGAYRRLLSLYYRRESAIPTDIGQACRLVRAISKHDKDAVELVLHEFFVRSDEGWTHKRCDAEIAAAQEKAKANKANGKTGGRPPKKPIDEAKDNPDATQTGTEQKPSGLFVGSDARAGPTATSHKPLASSSVAKATAEAAPSALTPKDRIWAMGVALLGEKGRAHLGKAIATYGEAVLLEVLADATREQPMEAKAWIVAACEARGRAKVKANGRHAEPQTTRDLLERDPHPEWAVRAGFNDIFAAETAGCGPGNADKFRDGQRVAA